MYTDGASRGNPGPGGYGVVLLAGSNKKELSGGFKKTTNNRMELLAVIAGLEALKKQGLHIVLYSFEFRRLDWRRRFWKTAYI